MIVYPRMRTVNFVAFYWMSLTPTYLVWLLDSFLWMYAVLIYLFLREWVVRLPSLNLACLQTVQRRNSPHPGRLCFVPLFCMFLHVVLVWREVVFVYIYYIFYSVEKFIAYKRESSTRYYRLTLIPNHSSFRTVITQLQTSKNHLGTKNYFTSYRILAVDSLRRFTCWPNSFPY